MGLMDGKFKKENIDDFEIVQKYMQDEMRRMFTRIQGLSMCIKTLENDNHFITLCNELKPYEVSSPKEINGKLEGLSKDLDHLNEKLFNYFSNVAETKNCELIFTKEISNKESYIEVMQETLNRTKKFYNKDQKNEYRLSIYGDMCGLAGLEMRYNYTAGRTEPDPVEKNWDDAQKKDYDVEIQKIENKVHKLESFSLAGIKQMVRLIDKDNPSM